MYQAMSLKGAGVRVARLRAVRAARRTVPTYGPLIRLIRRCHPGMCTVRYPVHMHFARLLLS
jgi:hypothetical protein